MRYYVVQCEEIIKTEDYTEVIEVWDMENEEGEDYELTIEKAKETAEYIYQLLLKHKLDIIYSVSDDTNSIAIVISVYDNWNIEDVIDYKEIRPEEWNVICGKCGAYCTEGTCFSYGHRVNYDTIGCYNWHPL